MASTRVLRKMNSVSVTVLVLVSFVAAISPATEVNDLYSCRFIDGISSEMDCALGDFNNETGVVRTLNLHLRSKTRLTSPMVPRIKVSRIIIKAPYLTQIADDAFHGFEETVLLLKIANGNLVNIPAAIDRLNRLRTLSLDRNNVHFLESSLRQAESVRHLVLSRNQISVIEKFAFHSNLLSLSLMDNRIRSLNGSLAYKNALKWLFISHNEISLLSGELDGMKSLQLLDASWNEIKDIAWASLKLPSLEILDLSHNEISTLGTGLEDLPMLRTLDLSNNKLDVLEANNFLSLRNLQMLSLSANLLRWMDDRVFDCLTKLSTLDLSFNQLKELSAVISPDGSALKDILSSMSTNTSVESEEEICDFRINTSLKTLNIPGNIWKCNSMFIQSLLRLQKEKVDLIGNPC